MDEYFSFSRAHAAAIRNGMGRDEALGFALASDYAARRPVVCREQLLAGMPGTRSLVRLDINGLNCEGEVPADLRCTDDEAEARAVIAAWQPRTTAALFAEAKRRSFTAEELSLLEESSLGWGGGWAGHTILGYDDVLAGGIAGVCRRIDRALDDAVQNNAPAATLDWYRGVRHVCNGISAFIANHATAAERLAAEAESADDAAHFSLIARLCAHVASDGVRTFHEAVQLFWFLHVLDNTDSPGRLDQFLWPYYQTLPGDDAEQRRAATPILAALWQRFIDCRSWNVCLGGQTADGRDAANALTDLCLDQQAHFNREAPNLSVRFFAGSPPELMARCVSVLAQGSGNPALYNDEVVVPALCAIGIPLEHARNYALNGCAQIDIQGMSHMGLEDGEVNLAKCLEFALHAGRSATTGRQVSLPTPSPTEIADFATLYEVYTQHVEHCTRQFTRLSNVFQQTIAEHGPHLYRSLFIDACLERGRDMRRGGPLYNHGQFLTEGVANTADALYAIKRLVFEEGRLTLPEFVAILDADWQGHEELGGIADAHPRAFAEIRQR